MMSLLGGAMIGLASVWLLLSTGRIAGISGIVARTMPPRASGFSVSLAFLAGLVAAAPIYGLFTGRFPAQLVSSNMPLLIVAGLLVGFGAVFGNGCTSGHGVCGISRLSVRSIVATCTFMLAAFVTVYVVRHMLGGAV